MIDAGTISASLVLDTKPFSDSLSSALNSLSFLGIFSGEQGEKIGSLGDILTSVGNRIIMDFQNPFRTAAGEVGNSCTLITAAVAGASATVAPSAQAMKNNILNPIRETAASGSDIMRDFGQGLINGLSSKQGSIIARAKAIAGGVTKAMKITLGIASPSRVMREVGRFTAEGMVLGLQDMNGEVQQASKALAQNAVSPVSLEARVQNIKRDFELQTAYPAEIRETNTASGDMLSRKLDTLIDLLSNGRQSIELDRRTFGTLVREYT